MGTKLTSYDEHIKKVLQDDKFVLGYLQEALEAEDMREELITLVCQNIIKARGEQKK